MLIQGLRKNAKPHFDSEFHEQSHINKKLDFIGIILIEIIRFTQSVCDLCLINIKVCIK